MKKIKKILALTLVLAMVATTCLSYDLDKAMAAPSSKYWIKVNKQANVATVYQNTGKKWVPIRAMVTSCGGSNTPSGTFNTTAKYKWKGLINNVKGQYSTRIVGSILFHSVWYYQDGGKGDQSLIEFNKLGRTASHGCVRLSTMDAKWIYDNCRIGTKVSIYSSSNPGPLGKPSTIKVSGTRGWDPTDPDPKNPRYLLKGPKITFSETKKSKFQIGEKVNLLSGVKAVNTYAKHNVSNLLKVERVDIKVNGEYKKYKMNTNRAGEYKITYSVKDKYSGTSKKAFYVVVEDTLAPTITDEGRTTFVGDTNLVKGITAKTKNGVDLTSKMKVELKAQGETSYKPLTLEEAKAYKFEKAGEYKIKVTVTNPANNKVATKTFVRNVIEPDAVITTIDSYNAVEGETALQIRTAILAKTKIEEKGVSIPLTVEMISLEEKAPKAIIKYVGSNGREVTKEVLIKYPVAPPVTTPVV
ncbi:MAG: L,D-transpeptidase [Anaerovoracaceae bacterium]